MRQHQHHHIALAENDIGSSTICTDCGTISLHFQQMSLRLDGESFHALVALLQQAQANIDLLSLTHPEHPAFISSQHAGGNDSVKSQVH